MTKPLERRPDLRPLLQATSVAVVGASERPRFGGWVLHNLRAAGYRGRLYAVNPRYSEVQGQPCYPTLAALPERPECAILALPNAHLLPALEAAAGLGIPAAVIFASAFSAPSPGAPALQDQLQAVAQAAGMALLGPNCMGLMALHQRLIVSGYEVRPDVPAGPVTFISHSGSVWDAVWQNRRGLAFNYLISAGNEVALTLADYIRFAVNDPTTRAVGLFMETVRDPATFLAALAEAAERDVPVVALKVGRSARGAELALTHSGALAGQDAAYDAIFARYGVRRARSLDELFDALELFAHGLRPPTRFIASVHDSGGERGLLVDTCDAEGVPFAAISPATTARLAEIVEPGLAPINPLDAWGTGNDYELIYERAVLALDADPATGLTVFATDLWAGGDVSRAYVDLALALQPRLSKPLVFLSNLAAVVGDLHGQRLRAAGIPVLLGTENGVRALGHLLAYAAFQRARAAAAEPPAPPPAAAPPWAGAGLLPAEAAAELLSAHGVPMAAAHVVDDAEAAVAAAEALGYPVAVKTAADLAHKTEQDGVRLGLGDPAAVRAAYADLAARLGARALVQRMAPAGVELILGLHRDPQFGLLLTLGLGGVWVEALGDVRVLALPVTRAEVLDAWRGLRGAPLLTGGRGRPPVALAAVVEATLGLARLAERWGPFLEAVDVNPLIATASGVVAVDAVVVTAAGDLPR